MKPVLLIAALICLAFTSGFNSAAQADQCVPPPAGIVGWWPGNGNANDVIGTNNGILSPTGATYAPGEVGLGFRLDGTNGYVEMPYSVVLDPTNVTLEAWVWLDPNANTNPVGESIIFKQNTWPAYFEGYSLLKASIENSDGTYTSYFQFVVSSDGDQVVINSLTVAQRGVWYHVAATYDGNQSTLYVNGVAEASAFAGFALDYGTEPVYFGTTGTPAPYADMFAGIIDEPSIYSRALASNEIAAIYNAGGAGKCSSLVPPPVIADQPTNETVEAGGTATFSVNATATTQLFYQWNSNNVSIAGATNSTLVLTDVQPNQSGSVYFVTVIDAGGSTNSVPVMLTVMPPPPCDPVPTGIVGWWPGNGNANDIIGTNNGFLSPAGATYAPGEVGLGFRLDGTNGFVEVPYSTVLEPTNITVEAWVWLDPNANTNPGNEVIVFKQNTWSYDFEAYGLCKASVENSDGTYSNRFQFVVSRDGDQVALNSLTVVQRGVWYHVAATYDGNQSTLYVNGVAEVSTNAGFPLDYGNEPVYFGTTGNPAPYTAMFAGIIDAPSIYSRALASNEIAAIYNAGSAGKCQPPAPPVILSQTSNQVVMLGSPATFNVTASGSQPLYYFWSQNNVLIPGATNSSYIILSAPLSDSGSQFSCLVSNAYGTAVSSNISLKVLDTVSNDLCSGAVVITSWSYTNEQSTLNASSDGDPVPDCVDGFGNGVWYQFNAPVNGLLYVDTFGSDFDTGLAAYTGSCDSLTEVACNDDYMGVTSQIIVPTTAGTTYYFLAGGYDGHTGDLIIHMNYLTPPVFVVQPTNISIVVSSNAIFSPTLSGAQPMTFQWYFNNSPLVDGGRISGSTNPTLTVADVQTMDAGNYQLIASNFLGTATSSVAVLTPVILPPTFIQPPTNQSVMTGSNANFSAIVGGTPPFTYQWYFNGNALVDDGVHIAGSMTASLIISNLTLADAGSYTLLVANVSGSASAAAALTVLAPPVIVTQPIGRSVPPGLPTVFTASATGVPTPSYQWQLNGTNIPGATSASYTNSAIGTNDLGFYQVVASNSLGIAVSSTAQLTFGPVAAWGLNASHECLPPPGLSNIVAIAGGNGTSYALRADGTIPGWGQGILTNLFAGATNAVALSIGDGGSEGAVLGADGTVTGVAPTPAGLTNIVAVSVGTDRFGYALRAEGTLEAWGLSPLTNTPAGLNHLTAVACGETHTVALGNDGSVFTWGMGPATNMPPGLSNIAAIAAGYSHSLALSSNGTVIAWGTGSGTNLPAGLTNIAAISIGYSTQGQGLSLAIRSNGTVVAWGDNPYGETNPPSGLTNLLTVAVAAGAYHSLALVNDGSPHILSPPVGLTAYTGRNVTLQGLAVGTAPLSYQWLLNGTNIPGATNTSLAIPDIQTNSAGYYQLLVSNSLNTTLSLPTPVNVISNGTLTFLSQPSGFRTNYQGSTVTVGSVTILGSGPLSYQWYFNTNNSDEIFTPVTGATNDTLIFNPALAIQSGYYRCVVSNVFKSSVTSSSVYQRVLFAKAFGYLATDPPFNLTNAIAIAVGNYGTQSPAGDYLALSSAGKISSWSGGQVEYGETNFASLSNSIVTAIAAGFGDTLALKSDGTVFAAGLGQYGVTNVPQTVNGITAIACGDYHDLALNYQGTVIGWGQNLQFQATNAAATNVVAIAAGGESSIALRADGSVITWGLDGNEIPIYGNTVPSNAVAVACGNGFYLALRTNGTVVAWGVDTYGQTTIPTNWTNIVAISAGANHATALRNDGTVASIGFTSGIFTSSNVPPNLANVIAIASSGDHDLALFGSTHAPVFTVQPWSRTVFNTTTSVWFSAKCVGVQPVHYQWQLNGTNLPTATNDTINVYAATTNSPGQRLAPLPLQPGIYQLIASNAYGVVASKYAQLTVVIPLGTALNATNLPWTTGGDAQWFGETNVSHDGVSAAQSGDIGQSQESDLFTTIATNYSGNCTFWWQVSSELGFDFLEFRINGIVQTNISGTTGWQPVSIHVPAGTNQLEWRYYKTSPFVSGEDAGWVDQFAFVPDPPLITLQPASQIVNVGTNVTFSIAVTGGKLSYQWRQNGNIVVTGGTLPTLTLNNVGRAQDGTYSVTVNDFVTGESTVSSNATLTVLVPQLLGTPTLTTNGSFQLTSGDINGGQIPAADLTNFEAQVSTNLINWTTLSNGLTVTNGMLLLQDSGSSNSPMRFYRIIEE